MPRLSSNAIPPNTRGARPRTFAEFHRDVVPPAWEPAPPRHRPWVIVMVFLVLAALAMQMAGTRAVTYRVTQARQTPQPARLDLVNRPADTTPPSPTRSRQMDVVVASPPRPTEVMEPVAPVIVPQLPVSHQPATTENFLTSPTTPASGVIHETVPTLPRRVEPAPMPRLGLMLGSMRYEQHLVGPDGRIVRSYRVGQLCHDLITQRARAASVPASRPGVGPCLGVKITGCQSWQVPGSPAYTSQVTLRAEWFDTAGRVQRGCFITGNCEQPLLWDDALAAAARDAVNGVMRLLE